MKILWFSITPALYKGKKATSGTWIESLLSVLKDNKDLDLAISFCTAEKEAEKSVKDGVHYYPLYRSKLYSKIVDKVTCKYEDKQIIQSCLHVIEDFKPDLIHIFGSEWCFGLLKEYTDIPIVIHMQGSWPSYRVAGGTPQEQLAKEIVRKWYNPIYLIGRRLTFHKSLERAKREEKILSINSNFMGRTRWDKALVELFSPKSKYYHCEEALRPVFMSSDRWKPVNNKTLQLVTVGSNSILKGYKLVLLTAHIIKEHTNVAFEWKIIGADKKFLRKFEFETGYRFEDNNITITGRLQAEKIKDIMLHSDMFVHTACIDNSPNAICEAQLLGLPIISTNVGGISSLFPISYPTDYLVDSNDPYYLASKIVSLYKDTKMKLNMSNQNYNLAHVRNSAEHINKQITEIYRKIINNRNYD